MAIKIPNDVLDNWVGRKVHIEGLPLGTVYKLLGFDGEFMLLRTPSTNKDARFHRSRALYLRQDEPQTSTISCPSTECRTTRRVQPI